MFIRLLAATFILSIALTPGAAQAAPQFFEGTGHWYEVFRAWETDVMPDDGVSWEEARAFSEACGGYLATVTSAEENEFIASALLDSNNDDWIWLGGYQDQASVDFGASNPASTGWKWITGEPWSYTNWTFWEPGFFEANDWTPDQAWYVENGSEDYLMMYGTGTWNDTDCSLKSILVVEYDQEPAHAPVPGTIVLLGAGLAALGFVPRKKKA